MTGRHNPVVRYTAAILLAALAQAARLPLHSPTLMPFITYAPFILLAAAFGGLGPGLLATGLCVLISDYFSLEPLHSFAVADPRNWVGVSALIVTGITASVLFDRLRRAHQRQRAANLELAAIQGHAPVILLVVDDHMRVRQANRLALQFGGCDVSSVLGNGPGAAIGCLNHLGEPEGCGHGAACGHCAVRETVSDTLRNGVPHTGVEAWIPVSIAGAEQLRCLRISTAAMQLAESTRTALICAQDVTDERLAEEELRAQAELVDLSHDAIIAADENRVITGWNTGAQEMYGWSQDESVGQVMHRLLQTTAAISVAAIDEILDREGRWDGELEHNRLDGTRLIVESRQVLLRESHGNRARILEINRDITERRRAESELREAHRRVFNLLESISDGFNAFDRDWRYVYVNLAGARMVHKSREELLGQNLWELWPDAVNSPFGEAYRRAVAENIPVQVEAFYPEPLNAWFEVRCYPSPEGLTLFFTDVTVRKQALEEIRRLNAELEQRVHDRTAELEAANKELEAFAYSVSHDLRAPLRGIHNWGAALAEDFDAELNAEARQYLERMHAETRRMESLIDDLLQLSRVTLRPLDRAAVDLTALANAIAAQLSEAHPDRPIAFAIQPGLKAGGDAGLLEIALTNLLGNAVKFTGRRAQAHIDFGRMDYSANPVFFVRDNGAGFDMSFAGSLFAPFQRLHKSSEFPGTGIGLATVQRVIRRHGGRIWVEAEPGRGATFYFTLE